MARHSFIRMSKLPDVKGRVDYISNPKRQEHLYATYSTVEPEFWQYLSDQAQHDYWKSNQPGGKCIEARELIIALPESLKEIDPNLLLQLIAEKFRKQYGVQCTAALHHNKSMTNYHIHLIFADRDILEKTEVKYASRNMFYDENGRHVRTKKEVLGEGGMLRPGCRMIQKGDPYEMNWFSGRKEIFKTKAFLQGVKRMYTELINQCVTKEADKLAVFDADGPYLATKKIGKKNPLAEDIKADNDIRQQWNWVVDQVLIAGGTVEEVIDFKQEEVVQIISASIKESGDDPRLFAEIIRRAITVLKDFLSLLMEQKELEEETAELQKVAAEENIEKKSKALRPDSRKEETEFRKLEGIYQKLSKANKKVFALQRQKETVQLALDQNPSNLFHRKDRRTLQERIDGLDRQIELAHLQLQVIPLQNGYDSVRAVKMAFQGAKAALEEVRRKQAEWDGYETMIEKDIRFMNEKKSIRERLAEKKGLISVQWTESNRPKSLER